MRDFNTPWVGSTRNPQKHLASWDSRAQDVRSGAVSGDFEKERRLMAHGSSDHFCTGQRRVAPKAPVQTSAK